MSFTVYKSSAGSGKTYTLVKEYLCLALQNPYKFRTILAITFTNKAADEMKQRILKTLVSLSDYQNLSPENKSKISFLLDDISIQTDLKTDEIIKNASVCLSLILHNYSNFAISTIDSFVQKIVRTFSNDLQLPVNFSIEMDGENLISQAVDLLINQIGNNELLTEFLIDFAKSKIDDDKSWHIENDLKDFSKLLLTEESQMKAELLKTLELSDFKEILLVLRKWVNNFENITSEIGKKAIAKINSLNIPFDAFANGKNGICSYFRKIAGKQIQRASNTINNNVLNKKWTAAKVNASDKANIDSISDFLENLYVELNQILDRDFSNYLIRINMLNNIYSLALLNEIEKNIAEIRENESTVHISEFNKRISEIVAKEPIPFIYERLGEKYKHFLVDEFQDTSVLQWKNLIPLIDNSLAENQFNMIVGDGKQAIYRFRGGEVEQFANLPEIFGRDDNQIAIERENSLKRNYEGKFLKSNFRSKAEIVDFNNRFFDFTTNFLNENLKSIYHNCEQDFNKNNTGGGVKIQFLSAEDKELYINETNEKILIFINEILNDGYEWKDITILCRNNKQANKIACYLSENKINIISNESLLLNSSESVRFLIALIKLIANNDDMICRLHIIQFLVQQNRKKDIIIDSELISKVNLSVQEFENIIQKLGYQFKLQNFNQQTIYQLCEQLCNCFKLEPNSNPYIQFFLDNVLNFNIKYNGNISDFLIWWDKKKEKLALKTPEGINAVNIMTIHKSKGLEFKNVIYPYADDKHRLTKENFWIDIAENDLTPLKTAILSMNKELLETEYAEVYEKEKDKSLLDLINLLYVALTRASERLYIITQFKKKKSETSISLPYIFIEFLINANLWNENIMEYQFGEFKINNTVSFINNDNILNIRTVSTCNWQEKLQISKMSPENWLAEDPDKQRRFGDLIHWILAKSNTIEECFTIIKDISTYKLNQEEKIYLKGLFTKLADDEDISFLFDKKFKARKEAELLTKEGKSLRPDLVLHSDNELIIVDFKTGKKRESHLNQLNEYADIISQMNNPKIIKALIYINEMPEIIKWE